MAEIQENLDAGTNAAPFRIDEKLHQIPTARKSGPS